jgi:hypothetical protein
MLFSRVASTPCLHAGTKRSDVRRRIQEYRQCRRALVPLPLPPDLAVPHWLMGSLLPNHAVFYRGDQEHVRKEPQPAGNAMYISLPCFRHMDGRHRHRFDPGLVMDVRELSTFENGTFDVAIDKGE